MTKYFVAKTTKGQEFLLDLDSLIAVPESSRQRICDALNNAKYRLKEGQIWHIYENDWYYNSHICHEIKRYGKTMKVRTGYVS